MDTISYKTRSANNEIIVKDWLLIDAEKEIVGRLASKVAILLRGKNKTYYTPNLNCGDNVIIINAEKVQFTGKKTHRQDVCQTYWIPRRTAYDNAPAISCQKTGKNS